MITDTTPANSDHRAYMDGSMALLGRISRVWDVLRRLPPEALDGQAGRLTAELVDAMDELKSLGAIVIKIDATSELDPLEAAREVIAARYPAPAEGGR